MDKQAEFVLRTIEERDIRFVRLWFTDVLGTLKSVSIAPAELEGAFEEGIGFDGSAIEGFARVHESDMLAKPDPSTFAILPWRNEGPGVARLFCDILMPDGSPSYADPRHVLKRTLTRAADLGFSFYTHPEVEFYLFESRPEPGAQPVPIDRYGYFDNAPHGVAHDFRRQAITTLEAMGISVEYSHHEGGPGQQEIDLRYADALTMADNVMTFRLVVQEVAMEQGLYATFMPKPFRDHPGSGMHTHLSLFEGDRNAFYEPGSAYQLSKVARSFIAGLLVHAPEITAVTNQGEFLQEARWWRGGTRVDLLGTQQPFRADPRSDVQAEQVEQHPHRVPRDGQRSESVPGLLRPPGGWHEGDRGGLRTATRFGGRRVEPYVCRATSDGDGLATGFTQPGDRGDGAVGAGCRDTRRTRLRLLPAQQACGVGGLPPPGDRLGVGPLLADVVS